MTASPLIIPVARFFSVSGGAGLAGGKVYTYSAGTNSLKTSYTDFSATVPNANPVILDSSGSAAIWLDGNYKINVLDSNNVQQANYPVDNVSGSSSGSGSTYAVTTGSANTYVLTPSPAVTAYTAGMSYNIKMNVANNGPSTINVSALGAQALVLPPSTALTGGELRLNSIYTIVYDGTNFQVLGSAFISTANAYTAQQNFAEAIITSTAASIAWNLTPGQCATHTLTENTTLANPTNMVNGGTYILTVIQAASAKTLAFGSAYKWPGGTGPIVSTGSGAVDIYTFKSNGTLMRGSFLQNFS